MISKKIYLYEDRKDVSLTTYILDDSPEMLAGKNRGAVLVCPGGAYLFCSDREGEPVAMAFAAMGYHAFVLRYSVYNENNPGISVDTSKPLPVKEHCIFPNPMRDIGKAMLYIKDNAAAWHVDADKIAVCGFSAGGHNCAMYSVYWDKPILTEHFDVEPEKLRPAAAILAYPLSDYLPMKEAAAGIPDAERLFHACNTAFLGMPKPPDELLAQVSPARLVDKNTPPTFIWSTYEDALVPVHQSILMAAALAENSVPFETHIFESGPHGLSTATQSSSGTTAEIDDDAAKWLPLCGEWLKKRFAFSLPDKRA